MLGSAWASAEELRIQSWDGMKGQIVLNTLTNPVVRHYRVAQGSSPSGPWTNVWGRTLLEHEQSITCSVEIAAQEAFFRAWSKPGMPDGAFLMGDSFDERAADERPVHAVTVSPFTIDKYEVSKSLWDEIRTWATGRGYSFDSVGSAKGTNHPVYLVNWYDCVKWCNARTEWHNDQLGTNALTPVYYTNSSLTAEYRRGKVAPYVDPQATGYRLPTEAEWELAARGGLATNRFPWGDLINHDYANYYANGSDTLGFDSSTNQYPMFHPAYNDGVEPYTCPVGDLPANNLGLHNMAGNVWEWCWDWYASGYYRDSPDTDPTGPDVGTNRVIRGGCYLNEGEFCRVADRASNPPDTRYYIGFRTVKRFQ